jgi:hypothetical protein
LLVLLTFADGVLLLMQSNEQRRLAAALAGIVARIGFAIVLALSPAVFAGAGLQADQASKLARPASDPASPVRETLR